MDIMLVLYMFGTGLVMGSFFNVVGLRMPEGKSILKPRSACPVCHHELTAIELIPLFSYLFQGGKCKNCKTKISFVYPMMELITGLLFVLTLYKATSVGMFVVSLTLISMLVVITVSDIAYQLILDKHLIFFSVLFIIERIVFKNLSVYNFLDALIVFVAILGFAFVMEKLLKKEALGGGDLKLLTVLAFILGLTETLLTIYIGAMAALVFIALSRKKDYFAFGPFLAFGAIVMWFYGNDIINLYFGLFN
jgi:leader peptidase (prepilin peptidase)/N-methyltransferase